MKDVMSQPLSKCCNAPPIFLASGQSATCSKCGQLFVYEEPPTPTSPTPTGIIIPEHAPPSIAQALKKFCGAIEGYKETGVWPDNRTLRRLADEGLDALKCSRYRETILAPPTAKSDKDTLKMCPNCGGFFDLSGRPYAGRGCDCGYVQTVNLATHSDKERIRQLETSLIKAQQENERLREELAKRDNIGGLICIHHNDKQRFSLFYSCPICREAKLREIAKGLAEATQKHLLYPNWNFEITCGAQSALTAYEDFEKDNAA